MYDYGIFDEVKEVYRRIANIMWAPNHASAVGKYECLRVG